jgi:hypothetical protein
VADTAVRPVTEPGKQSRKPTERATQWVLFGSLASGIGALLFQIIGVDILGEEAYQPITTLWTIQYLSGTVVLYSAEAFVARSLHHGITPAALDRSIRVIAAWVAVAAIAITALTWFLRDQLYAGEADLALVAGLLIASYGAFYVIKGRMAGTNRFRSYGAATALESIGRILLAVPVLLLLDSTQSLAWIMPIGPALVVAWWLYDRGRTLPADPEAAAALSGPEDSGATRFLAATTAANAVSQVLLAAGPLVLIPLGASPAEISVFFLVVTAARVPLVFAIGGLLSRVLGPLTRLAREARDHTLRRIALLAAPATLVLGVVGAAVAYPLGPPVLELVLRISRPDPAFVAMTVFGVVLATGSLLLNQILIARRSEGLLVAPWMTALVAASLAVALAPGIPTMRVSIGFVTGEVVALLGLLIAILRAPRLSPPAAAAVATAE